MLGIMTLDAVAAYFYYLLKSGKMLKIMNIWVFYNSIGAWILTPGSNTGVYKMVGSAVKDHLDATGSTAMNNIVLLGIAAWGSVASRENLTNTDVSIMYKLRLK